MTTSPETYESAPVTKAAERAFHLAADLRAAYQRSIAVGNKMLTMILFDLLKSAADLEQRCASVEIALLNPPRITKEDPRS